MAKQAIEYIVRITKFIEAEDVHLGRVYFRVCFDGEQSFSVSCTVPQYYQRETYIRSWMLSGKWRLRVQERQNGWDQCHTMPKYVCTFGPRETSREKRVCRIFHRLKSKNCTYNTCDASIFTSLRFSLDKLYFFFLTQDMNWQRI